MSSTKRVFGMTQALLSTSELTQPPNVEYPPRGHSSGSVNVGSAAGTPEESATTNGLLTPTERLPNHSPSSYCHLMVQVGRFVGNIETSNGLR